MSNETPSGLDVRAFWYAVAESRDLGHRRPLGVELLGEWIALYRNRKGGVTAVQDRCLHRNARLSEGDVREGELNCPYHAWRYGARGEVTRVPSEGAEFSTHALKCLKSYPTAERDGYIYVRGTEGPADIQPLPVPFLGRPGYGHIRLKHLFEAQVPNCAENFIDIPHTTSVHPGIFRFEREPQKLGAEVERENGNVHIRYRGETSNFGFFSKILNRSDREIFHEDHYYLPNVTHVEYRFPSGWHFNITSQSVPLGEYRTLVYTDLTYDYGWLTRVARPVVRWAARKIIAQDVRIMRQQSDVTRKYGELFLSTKADIQHVWIEKIYAELLAGRDPRQLPPKKQSVEFWI